MAEYLINNEYTLDEVIQDIHALYEQGNRLKIKVTTAQNRTLSQNAALHLYCTWIADALNDSGLDMRQVMKPEAELPWTPETVKDLLWRPIQKAMFGHDSTTKPTPDQYPDIYETLNRHLADKFGVSRPWPCRETMDISD